MKESLHKNAKTPLFDLNYQLCASMQAMGCGPTDATTLTGFLDLPSTSKIVRHLCLLMLFLCFIVFCKIWPGQLKVQAKITTHTLDLDSVWELIQRKLLILESTAASVEDVMFLNVSTKK